MVYPADHSHKIFSLIFSENNNNNNNNKQTKTKKKKKKKKKQLYFKVLCVTLELTDLND